MEFCRSSDEKLQKIRWRLVEVQRDHGKDLDGIFQVLGQKIAELQVDNCRGSDGVLQRFRWNFADLDGQLQRLIQTYAGVQMDFYRSSTASLEIPF